jgi:sulfur-oxidizing protein SoxX
MPHILLGGTVRSNKTYADLVTAIINPSHKIPKAYEALSEVRLPGNRSKMEMYNYNEVMTVQELIDIVTFLQLEYRMVLPEGR